MIALSVSSEALLHVSRVIAARLGLSFPEKRWDDLQRGLEVAASELGFAGAGQCIQWLQSEPYLSSHETAVLAACLTVAETYFFREIKTLEAAHRTIFREIIRRRTKAGCSVRIWSAGCCTGEEPYSIAIQLHSLLGAAPDCTISILGTDINPSFLDKAIAGIYQDWSFRDTPISYRDMYFRKIDDSRYEILPQIKKMVNFAVLNLAEQSFPSRLNHTSAIDMIFCRNVLMYLAPEIIDQVLLNFYKALADGGWLVVAPSEVMFTHKFAYTPVVVDGVTLLHKVAAIPDRPLTVKESIPSSAARPSGIKPGTSSGDHREATKTAARREAETMAPQDAHELYGEAEKSRNEPHHNSSQTAPDRNRTIRVEGSTNHSAAVATDSHHSFGVEMAAADHPIAPLPEPMPLSPYQEGCRLFEQKRFQEAAQALAAVRPNEPEQAHALALLTQVHANLGNLERALEFSERAIAADRKNPSLFYLRAVLDHELGNTDDALEAIHEAIKLSPDFIPAHFLLGHIKRKQGHEHDSKQIYEHALALLNNYRRRGGAEWKTEETGAAELIDAVQTMIALNDQRTAI